MKAKEFLLIFVQSLNPKAYPQLFSRKKREVAKYFFTLLFYCVLLSGLTNLPNFIMFPQQVEGAISKITRFNITGLDVEISEPVVLLDRPKIVIDFSENITMEGKWLLITKSDIYYKKFQPRLFSPVSTEQKPVAEYSDLLDDITRIGGTYWIILIILLPSLFFMSYFLNFFKYSVIVSLMFMLSYLFTRFILRKKLNLQHIIKAVFFSSSVMIFLDIVITPLLNLSVIPFLLYLIILSLVLYNESEKKQRQDN